MAIERKIIGLTADMGDFEVKFMFPLKTSVRNKIATDSVSVHPHIHFDTEIHFILCGKYTLVTDCAEFVLKKNDVCIIPKGISHELIPENEHSHIFNMLLSVYPLHLKTKRKSVYQENVQLWKALKEVQIFENCSRLCEYVQDLIDFGKTNEYINKSVMTIAFFRLTELIRQRFPCRSQLADACHIHYDASYFDAELENYIMLRYRTRLPLTEVAEHIGISTAQLSRIIKKNYGMSYSNLITTLRMNEAKRLLQTGMTMTDIAKSLGYSSYNGFAAAFKRHFESSPNTFINKGEKE